MSETLLFETPGTKQKHPVWDSMQQLANENKPKWHILRLIDNFSDSPSTGE